MLVGEVWEQNHRHRYLVETSDLDHYVLAWAVWEQNHPHRSVVDMSELDHCVLACW